MPYCINCGQEIINDAKFCHLCGMKVEETAEFAEKSKNTGGSETAEAVELSENPEFTKIEHVDETKSDDIKKDSIETTCSENEDTTSFDNSKYKTSTDDEAMRILHKSGNKFLSMWNNMTAFEKIMSGGSTVFVILAIIAFFCGSIIIYL